jgi:hypothetical protein
MRWSELGGAHWSREGAMICLKSKFPLFFMMFPLFARGRGTNPHGGMSFQVGVCLSVWNTLLSGTWEV